MSINRFFQCTVTLAVMAFLGLSANAGNININAARETANGFLKQQAFAQPGTFRSPGASDIHLVHAEASSIVSGANSYYAFNIKGGGFIIVSGEDRAPQVLGYSDQGHLDFNHLPTNLIALLSGYKEQIEYLQAHPQLNITPTLNAGNGSSVAPLIKSLWGQEMPYNLQCPIYDGEYCVVGCVATAMSQVMHYWQYPTSTSEISSYYCYDIGQTLPALPATNFEYDKMLLSYCHWDWDLSQLIQDTYTDEQAQAVAKLARYCGQAVRMGYSPEGSGAYVSSQLSAMKNFGYSEDARDVSRSSWWEESYTTEEWEAMIKTELDAGRPILYSADDIYGAGGHAFVCDGYDTNGMFHFNFGWYGTCNGWYVSTALNMTHRDGEELRFNSGHEMLLGIVPPEYCVISTELEASSKLLILGEDLNAQALDVNIMTSFPYTNFVFSLTNAADRRVCNSTAIKVTTDSFEQGSTLDGTIKLPETLESGIYDLCLYRYYSMPRSAVKVICNSGKLHVVRHAAKYGEPYDVDDVVKLISYVLNGNNPDLSVSDVTALIDVVLNYY